MNLFITLTNVFEAKRNKRHFCKSNCGRRNSSVLRNGGGKVYDEKCLARIGGNLRFLRMARQISQQDMAEHIGISQTHLSNLEHGHVQVNLKLLLRSANVLGCSLETLLDRKAATEWAEAHCTDDNEEAGVSGGCECKAADVEEQQLYSLEEVRRLLELLRLTSK